MTFPAKLSEHKVQGAGSSTAKEGPTPVPPLKKLCRVSSAVLCSLLPLASYSSEQTAILATIAQLLSGEGRRKGSKGSWRGGNHRGHEGAGVDGWAKSWEARIQIQAARIH